MMLNLSSAKVRFCIHVTEASTAAKEANISPPILSERGWDQAWRAPSCRLEISASRECDRAVAASDRYWCVADLAHHQQVSDFRKPASCASSSEQNQRWGCFVL